jgi:hypothetical protein
MLAAAQPILEHPMTVTQRRPAAVPGPRTAEPEPWLYPLRTQPRSQYWDVFNARWATRGPVPGQRQ